MTESRRVKLSDKKENLIGGRRLARNVFWNLLGAGAPLLVAIVAIPILIDGLGTARFGVLTLAWMVVGYFSLFDLGLGRALTKLVAEMLGKGQVEQVPPLIWTAMSLMMVLGVLGAVVFAAFSPWLVLGVLNIPLDLQHETLTAFYLLAVSIPIVIGTTGLRGILEAHQRFGLVNAVRMPLGVITFLGPVLVLPFSNSLVAVVAVLVIARICSWFVYIILCVYIEPAILHSVRIQRALVRPLMSFGGWMTVTNIVGPLMVYIDRFLIGSMVSMTAVAYYATPYEIVTKLWIIPGAIMGVIFPAFSADFNRDRIRSAYLFNQAINYIFITIFPVVLIIITFSKEGLDLWLGNEFANSSSMVLQLLSVGVFINCLAQVPYGLVQGAGRPDYTAKLHLVELPFYLVILWLLVDDYGIIGAAIAWVLRVFVDAVLLFVMANRMMSVPSLYTRQLILLCGGALFTFVLGVMIQEPVIKVLFMLVVCFFLTTYTWFKIFGSVERGMIRSHINKYILFFIKK